jgi:tetratricopeptide (TPR) repeat protein
VEPLKRLLIARTEGNPFFLEESVRTLVETRVLVGEPGAYRLAQDLPTIHVPATVQAVLAARIDRLEPEEKRLLQTAAVIGTAVPFSLLRAIAELPEEMLHQGLTHLQAAEFFYETRLFPEHEYTFKHALTHEVAYGSLLQEQRRALHTRIVEAIEALAGDRVADQVERLAHHAWRGEVWDKALTYFWQAGVKAEARSANREAVVCFEQALGALGHFPKDRDMIKKAIDLRFDLQHPLFMLGELDRMFAYLRETENFAQAIDNQSQLAIFSQRTAYYLWLIGDHARAVDVGQQALTYAEALQDPPLQVRANTTLGRIYVSLGDYRRAVDCFRKNVVYLEDEPLREYTREVIRSCISSCTWLGRCCAELGAFAEGVTFAEKALRVAEATKDAYQAIAVHRDIGHVYLCKGDFYKAIPTLERGLELCQVRETPVLFPIMAALLGYGYSLTGRHAEALPLLEQALERAVSMRLEYARSLWITLLGEVDLLTGHLTDATDHARHALHLSRHRKERGYQAYTLRLLGEIAARRHPPDVEEAEASYQEALTLANELGMRPLQAHCHLGLGTLYSQMGRVEQARTELATAITLYRSMEMTFWLPQAEAALAQV